jgi:hypothetical protein
MRKQRLIACSAVLVGIIAVSVAQAEPDQAKAGPGKPDGAAHPGKPDGAGPPGKPEGKAKDPSRAEPGSAAGKGSGERGKDKHDDAHGHGHDHDHDKDHAPHGKALGHHHGLRGLLAELKDGKLKKADLKDRLAKLRENQGERRKHHQGELKARWGATLAMPAVREELQHHARRMARLNRALFVAQTEVTKDQDKLVGRIEKLIDKEQARHQHAMSRFRAPPKTPGGSADLAAPAAAPAGAAAPSPAAAAPAASAAPKAGDK